jgi:hypothetical protein
MIKPRRVSWAEHIACMSEKRNAYKDRIIKPDGRRSLENLDTDRNIILKYLQEK